MLNAIVAGFGWLLTPAGVNALFALVCLVAAFGASVRSTMVLAALLYVALIFV